MRRSLSATDACTPEQIAALEENDSAAIQTATDIMYTLRSIRLWLGVLVCLVGLLVWRLW